MSRVPSKKQKKQSKTKKFTRTHILKQTIKILKMTPHDGEFHGCTELTRILGTSTKPIHKSLNAIREIREFPYKVEISGGSSNRLFIRIGGKSGNEMPLVKERRAKEIVDKVGQMMEP